MFQPISRITEALEFPPPIQLTNASLWTLTTTWTLRSSSLAFSCRLLHNATCHDMWCIFQSIKNLVNIFDEMWKEPLRLKAISNSMRLENRVRLKSLLRYWRGRLLDISEHRQFCISINLKRF